MLRKSVARLPLAALIAGLSYMAGSALAAEGGPELPDGDARALVETFCVACHQTNYIPRSGGYTAEHWRELVLSMVDLNDRPQLGQIVDYLAACHLDPSWANALT